MSPIRRSSRPLPAGDRTRGVEPATGRVATKIKELCAEAVASGKRSRTLRLHVKIGAWRTSTSGEGVWVPLPRELRRIAIEGEHGSLDVRLPSELTKSLDIPGEKWPKVELKVGIEVTPRQ